MTSANLEQQLAGLAALDDPVRRSLYFHVVQQQREVSRDEAALAAGISRTLAGFHLDRLARDGLLDTSFRRLSGRAGPGAGRPAKLYRRSHQQIDVSLPRRHYDLAATILAAAIEAGGVSRTRRALKKAARAIGRQIGSEAKAGLGSRPGEKRRVAGALSALAAQGYEPAQTAGAVRLHNCPFHALVAEHKDLVCGMNLALMEGVVDGIDMAGARAALDPRPGMCCVVLRLRAK